MHTSIVTDTYDTTKELIKIGVSEPTAKAIAQATVQALNESLATKHDMALIYKEIEQLRKETEQLRADTKRDIAEIRKDIEQLRTDTQKDIAQLRKDVKKDIIMSNGKFTILTISILGGLIVIMGYLNMLPPQ